MKLHFIPLAAFTLGVASLARTAPVDIPSTHAHAAHVGFDDPLASAQRDIPTVPAHPYPGEKDSWESSEWMEQYRTLVKEHAGKAASSQDPDEINRHTGLAKLYSDELNKLQDLRTLLDRQEDLQHLHPPVPAKLPDEQQRQPVARGVGGKTVGEHTPPALAAASPLQLPRPAHIVDGRRRTRTDSRHD